jgi:hypothetical protein
MRYLILPIVALALSGCITEDTAADDAEGGGAEDAGGSGASGASSGGDAGDDTSDPDRDGDAPPTILPDGDGPPPALEDGGVEDPAPEDGGVETPPDAMRPAPDDREGLIEAVCRHWYACFERECAPFADADWLEDICDSLDAQPTATLNDLLDTDCWEVVVLTFQDEEDATAYCSEEPPTPACEQVCSYLTECGVDEDETDFCPGYCRTLDDAERQCFLDARERQDCPGYFACFEEPEDPAEACDALCEKQWRCLTNECAGGSIEFSWFGECQEACQRNPPSADEAGRVFDALCEEIVPELLADDAELAGACEAMADEACQRLCDGRLSACNIEACEARCAGWNDSNFYCLQFVDGCDEIEPCLQDGEARDLCERACGRYEECLLEACPPRIIRPTLDEECTAGCLFDPPDPQGVEDYVNLECRQVRELVYQESRELAPLCEGGREFRPSADECAAFCENTLAACIGVGGRQFCLGACATLEREQYQCALEAQGDCAAIDRCLE